MADMEADNMAREMTPQERAAALVEQMLVFIEKTSRRKLSFSAIVDMNTGKTENPQDRLIAAVTKHDQQTRRAALLEAAQVAIIYGERARDEDLSGGYTSELIAQALDRLAQEG